MDFSGPEPADYRNVQSLNYQFLFLARNGLAGHGLQQQSEPMVNTLIAGLTDLQIDRFSQSPFLLFSLRERDEEYWSFLSAEDRTMDLFVALEQGSESSQLAAAGLAFLWQLARRNPYAARLVSGATLNWCEQLAGHTLLYVLQRMAGRSDLLMLRRAEDADFWNKLLGPGLSSEPDVRKAAQLSALQTILTDDSTAQYRPMRAAACSLPLAALRVADKRDR